MILNNNWILSPSSTNLVNNGLKMSGKNLYWLFENSKVKIKSSKTLSSKTFKVKTLCSLRHLKSSCTLCLCGYLIRNFVPHYILCVSPRDSVLLVPSLLISVVISSKFCLGKPSAFKHKLPPREIAFKFRDARNMK